MRIIKQGKEELIKRHIVCERCECEFEVRLVECQTATLGTEDEPQYYYRCPCCGKKIVFGWESE